MFGAVKFLSDNCISVWVSDECLFPSDCEFPGYCHGMFFFFFFFYYVMDILGILSLWVLFKRQSGCLEKFADPG